MRKTQTPARTAALAVSTLSFALFAMLASPGATAASGNPASGNSAADIPAGIRFAMQRDLGIMPGQIPQYLAAEKRAPQIERNARSTLGDSYAGTWLERNQRGEYESVVAVSNPRDAAKARAPGVQVRLVSYSLRQLEAAHARLDGAAKAIRVTGKAGRLDPRIHTWHVDPMSNSVVVTTDPDAADAAVDFVAASGADARTIRFAEAQGRPQTTQLADVGIFGGEQIRIGTGSCSVGFAVTLGPNEGYVTAGHCGTAGLAVVHVASGYTSGAIVQSVFPVSDFAIVHDTFGWTHPEGRVLTYQFGGGPLPVVGGTPAALNAQICRSGFTTGARCGFLTAIGVTVNYGGGNIVNGLSQASACVGRGDSGGSFITPAGQAQGVTSGGLLPTGGNDNCALTAPVTYFQPLQPILASIPGLTLRTSP